MGTGANCSYTADNGTYVQQLCNDGYAYCCSTAASVSVLVCSQNTCGSAQSDSNANSTISIDTFVFWLILGGTGVFTLVVLLISYVVCRYRKPGCADISEARARFLEENIMAVQVRSGGDGTAPISPSSVTPVVSSPASGHTPAASPDLLVQRPVINTQVETKKPGPKKKVGVNKAFMMGAEAFARKAIAVPRPKVGATAAGRTNVHTIQSRTQQGQGQPTAGSRPGGAQTHRVLAGQRSTDSTGSGGVASPRLVHVGGFTPRVPLRDKGRTESKQTILSKDSDNMTTVGT